ncbi:hypothetical protein OESDEN_23950 [Oesophagostomum dentatum]|uniref:Uncharacterized protein n=1 Tax=Oesophagostomum dentatum TaxID=61180 RepID=A0A0B1RZM2_OESDE|nr:hypothetical protein OESDEN_23950 [Oesophagostomum dentatum]
MSHFLFFLMLTLLCTAVVCRPQYKDDDFDYRMFEDDNAGVVIDRVIEPRHKHDSHHHHHHSHRRGEKAYLKTNRVQRVKKFLDSFRL